MEYFTVKLRQQLQVGLPAHQVSEVLSLNPRQICPIPSEYPLLLGVVNWRGRLLWCLNLSDFLRLRPEPLGAELSFDSSLTSRDRLAALVISGEPGGALAGRSLVCLVTRLQGVVEVPEVQPLPRQFPEPLRQAFCGIARQSNPLLLLNTERLLDVAGWESMAEPALSPSRLRT